MRISARCDYACKALLELSLHWPSKDPLQIHTISEKQAIPMRYLVQILIQLKRMGMVLSVRGKEGGYALLLPPNRISLGEVIRKMEGHILPLADSINKKNGSIFATIWEELEGTIAKVLDRISFEDVCNKERGANRTIIYQI